MAGNGKGILRIAIEDFLETSPIGKWINSWFVKVGEDHETAIIKHFAKMLNQINALEDLPDEMKLYLNPDGSPSGQGGIAQAVGFAMGIGGGAASSFLAPLFKKLNYAVDVKAHSARFDPQVAIALIFRNPEMTEKLKYDLLELGWDQTRTDLLIDLLRPRFQTSDIMTLFMRGLLDTNQTINALTKYGWSNDDQINLLELTRMIPPVNDLISMAVREAFTPATVERFGYDQDFPNEVLEWTKKQGLSEEWTKKYWYAHWQLPGVNQAYEMLHRLRPDITDNAFTDQDMDIFLKTIDIPVFFRSKLKDISYAPYTRVDVRRMFGVGVLSENDVYNSYRDIGYDHDHAMNLTKFTVTVEKAEEKGLTRSAITDTYKRGLITRSVGGSMLNDLGYNPTESEFWLNLVDYDIEKARVDEELNYIEKAFINGILDDSTIYDRLNPLNLPAEKVNELIQLWTIRRQSQISLPSRSDLDGFYKDNIINQDQYRGYMIRRGYEVQSIDFYIQSLNIEAAEKAKSEAEKASKELERIEKSKYSNDYMKAKSRIEVDQSELRYAIADIKVILHDIEDQELRSTYAKLVDEIKRDIVNLDYEKSELTRDYIDQIGKD